MVVYGEVGEPERADRSPMLTSDAALQLSIVRWLRGLFVAHVFVVLLPKKSMKQCGMPGRLRVAAH